MLLSWPVLLLHVFHPGKRPYDQVPTWEALAALEGTPWLYIRHRVTITDYSYSDALQEFWGYQGLLVVCEQDHVPTLELIGQLVACPGDWCAWDYLLAHGVLWSEANAGPGTGLMKFSMACRQSVAETPEVPHVPHPDMPGTLELRLPPIHVHRPAIAHNHVAA